MSSAFEVSVMKVSQFIAYSLGVAGAGFQKYDVSELEKQYRHSFGEISLRSGLALLKASALDSVHWSL